MRHIFSLGIELPSDTYTLTVYRVYCKYHYLEGHESLNSEVEAWKFLVGLSKNEIDITKQQYTKENETKTFSLHSK